MLSQAGISSEAAGCTRPAVCKALHQGAILHPQPVFKIVLKINCYVFNLIKNQESTVLPGGGIFKENNLCKFGQIFVTNISNTSICRIDDKFLTRVQTPKKLFYLTWHAYSVSCMWCYCYPHTSPLLILEKKKKINH